MAACVIAGSIAVSAIGTPGGTHPANAQATRSLIWGAHVRERDGQTAQQAVIELESLVGQRLRAVRVFSKWGDRVPDQFESWLGQTNRMMLFSVKPLRRDGTLIPWAAIADAEPGTVLYREMEQLGDDLAAFGQPVYLIFHHEPEAALNLNYGTSADYVRAWRKFVTVIRSRRATNVKYLWTLMEYSFQVPLSDRRAAANWYPGDDVVDAIGADAYNWYQCRGRDEGWKPLAKLIEPLRLFGQAHPNAELWLPEYGTMEDPAVPGRKAAWFDEATALFAQPGWEQFRGMTYFHDVDPRLPGCDPRITTSPSSTEAFGRTGASPIFGGSTTSTAPTEGPTGGFPTGGVTKSIVESAAASIPAVRVRPTP
jgi:hypothetical protein